MLESAGMLPTLTQYKVFVALLLLPDSNHEGIIVPSVAENAMLLKSEVSYAAYWALLTFIINWNGFDVAISCLFVIVTGTYATGSKVFWAFTMKMFDVGDKSRMQKHQVTNKNMLKCLLTKRTSSLTVTPRIK